MTTDLEFRIGCAKGNLVIEQPFIATLVCAMPITLDDTIYPPTLCTNGKWIKAHPDWVSSHTLDELKWALAHETMHCVFQHMLRRGDRDPRKWNIAGDYIINYLLEVDKVGKRPANVLYDKALYDKGQTTEGVYALLPDDDGSGSGGPFDNCEDMPGDASEQAREASEWQVRVAQAAAAAKACGKMSATMREFVDELLSPKVDWTHQLRDFFTKRSRTDRTYARLNRRFISQGISMPGKSGTTIGDIVIAVDHSGSIDLATLNIFAAEMRGIKQDCAPPVTHIIYFHHEVSEHVTLETDDDLEVHPGPPGGTAFSPIFRFIADNDIHPCAVVVLTDLYCGDFGPVPDYPVMWATIGADKAPWGDVIKIT